MLGLGLAGAVVRLVGSCAVGTPGAGAAACRWACRNTHGSWAGPNFRVEKASRRNSGDTPRDPFLACPAFASLASALNTVFLCQVTLRRSALLPFVMDAPPRNEGQIQAQQALVCWPNRIGAHPLSRSAQLVGREGQRSACSVQRDSMPCTALRSPSCWPLLCFPFQSAPR